MPDWNELNNMITNIFVNNNNKISIYRVIQNKGMSLKEHIPERILRQLFLWQKFIRSLVFKL
jgi:hypothetical protein